MKVKYLREGVFKNPEQARATREKTKDLSNAEKLTSVANKIVKEPIIRFLNELLNKFLTGPYKHRYSTTYIEAYRNDPMCIAPDFMSSYCIFKNKNICDIWYEYQRVTITDIDLENKTMDVLISLGQPHPGLPRYVVKQNNNDSIVYGTYLDNLYGLVDTSMFKKDFLVFQI